MPFSPGPRSPGKIVCGPGREPCDPEGFGDLSFVGERRAEPAGIRWVKAPAAEIHGLPVREDMGDAIAQAPVCIQPCSVPGKMVADVAVQPCGLFVCHADDRQTRAFMHSFGDRLC